MNHRIAILSLLSFLSITLCSCDDRPIDDKCTSGETFCVSGTTNYIFTCKAEKDITYWDGTKCDGTCDKAGKLCITSEELGCSDADKKIDDTTKACVCIDSNKYLNDQNECVCKNDYMKKNDAGECVCKDSHANLDDTGKCVCQDPLATMNGAGICECSDKDQEINQFGQCECKKQFQELNKDSGKCVCQDPLATINDAGICECTDKDQEINQFGQCECKNKFQALNKDSGKCECIDLNQEIDNSGMCKCKDSNQELNVSSGKCECRESDQQIGENGECICKDPNAEPDNNHQCQCKNGYYLKDDQCVSGDDANRNHMYDRYETSDIQGIKDKLGKICTNHAYCDSVPGKGDGFCDSFIGYQCSIRCVSDEQCVSEQSIDGTQYHFVCRPDGRCAPDTFTTVWNISYDSLVKDSISIQFDINCKTDKVHVVWGDGSKEDVDCSKKVTHKYTKQGQFIVEINDAVSWTIDFNHEETINAFAGVRSFGQAGIGIKSFAAAKKNFEVSKVDIPDATLLKSMEYMFYNANAFNQPIGNWDVSNVTSMVRTFLGASSFNQNIGQWDVSKVNTMSHTFANASSFNQDIHKWDVSNVTYFVKMFYQATAFNQDISNWKVNKENATGCGMLIGSGLDDPDSDNCKDDFSPKSLWGSGFVNACAHDAGICQ